MINPAINIYGYRAFRHNANHDLPLRHSNYCLQLKLFEQALFSGKKHD